MNILEECGFTLLIDYIWVKYDYVNGDKIPKFYANATLGNLSPIYSTTKFQRRKYIVKKADDEGVVLITNNSKELKEFITRESRDSRIEDLLG